MDIEVIERWADRGLEIDPSRHEIQGNGGWIETMRRELEYPELFLYRHKVTGNFVLAAWLEKPKRCLELVCYEIHPALSTDPKAGVEYLRRRVDPTINVAAEMRKRVEQRRREERLMKEDALAERTAATKWMRKKGMEQAADMIDTGAMPYAKPKTDEEREAAEELKREARR